MYIWEYPGHPYFESIKNNYIKLMGEVGMAVQNSIQTRVVGLGIIRYMLHPYCFSSNGISVLGFRLDSFLLTHCHDISTWFVQLAKLQMRRRGVVQSHTGSAHSCGYFSSCKLACCIILDSSCML